jgi:flagellar biosynthesis protein FlhA
VLTIGDGLVTVIPALMISISGGLIVTRASSDSRLGADFRKQVFGNPQPLMLASGVLLALAVFPGLPKIPFLLLSAGIGTSAWQMRKRGMDAKKVTETKTAPARENLEAVLRIEPLAVEVGLGLVRLVEGGINSPLLRRISGIRRQLAGDLGYVFPPVRVTDNLSLRPREYLISLKGVEIARYEMPQGCDLAIPVGKAAAPFSGQATREPAFGMPAWWIPSDQAERARRANYTVVDAVSVLGTHLAELIRRHAHELFSRQDAKKLLDRVAVDNPKVVEELTPKLLPLATVQRVLQNLLRERVSIRDVVSILEALSEAAASSRNPILLTEYVRQAIRRSVVKPYLNSAGDLPAYFVEPSIEQSVESAVQHGEQNSHLSMSPQAIRDILSRIEQKTGSPETPVVTVTSSGARYFLRQMAEASQSNVVFLSHNEVPAELKVISQGLIQ